MSIPHTPDASATNLLSEMKSDIDLYKSGEEIDFAGKYATSLLSIGAVPVLTELFRSFEDSTLFAYLSAVPFLWKDLPFSAWKQILYRISDSTQAIYQFVWFAAPFLGIDVLSMIDADPHVDERARAFVRLEFPRGAPPSRNWEREVLENSGVDPVLLWRRLASEGAPMKVDLSRLDQRLAQT
jgi:hypothetical protein